MTKQKKKKSQTKNNSHRVHCREIEKKNTAKTRKISNKQIRVNKKSFGECAVCTVQTDKREIEKDNKRGKRPITFCLFIKNGRIW